MKRKILTVLVIFILGKAVAQVDSTSVKPKTNLLKKNLVPLSLIGAGILYLIAALRNHLTQALEIG